MLLAHGTIDEVIAALERYGDLSIMEVIERESFPYGHTQNTAPDRRLQLFGVGPPQLKSVPHLSQ